MGNEPVRKAKRWSTPGHGMLADALQDIENFAVSAEDSLDFASPVIVRWRHE